MRLLFLFLLLGSFGFASEVPDFRDLSKSRGVVFLLTTPKSGSNLVSSCLSIITRRPISWIRWGSDVLKPYSERTKHISYNRLGLPLVSSKPLLYRTHYEFRELSQVSSLCNQLIFLTRNPKELLFRAHLLHSSEEEEPSPSFIENFLREYLVPFKVYESWDANHKMLVYYEDLIGDQDQILLDILDFMKISPTYFEDFIKNKEKYMERLLTSYKEQHAHNRGGSSSRGGPKAIFYSRNAKAETLRYIDAYLMRSEPDIWNLYLKRFAS